MRPDPIASLPSKAGRTPFVIASLCFANMASGKPRTVRKNRLKELEQIVQGRAIDVEAQRTKLDSLLVTLKGNETGLWMTHPKAPPFADFDVRIGRRQPIVITIANH